MVYKSLSNIVECFFASHGCGLQPLNTTDYYINKNRNKYVFSNITEYLLKLGNKK